MRFTSKTLAYVLLTAGAALFILPFVWMVLTSLKPLDQTMLQPQSWLPRRFEAEINGKMQEVRPGAVVTEPSVWATELGAPQPVALPEDSDEGWRLGADRGLATPGRDPQENLGLTVLPLERDHRRCWHAP